MLLKLMKKNAATELDQEDQDKVALLLETQKFDHEIERICEHDKKRELWAWKTSQKPEDSLIPVLKKILTEYSRRVVAPSVQPKGVPRMQLANHRSVSVADDSVVIDEQDEMEGFDDLEAPEEVNNKGERAAEKKNRKKQRAAAKAAAKAAAGISISGAALQEEAVRAAQVYYNG